LLDAGADIHAADNWILDAIEQFGDQLSEETKKIISDHIKKEKKLKN
jgi:hypothetical protein